MIMANRSYRSFAYRNPELGLEHPVRSTIKVVHIVQHLRPGGIETLALDFLEAGFHAESLIISLEGNQDDAVRCWPRLAECRGRIRFLSKKPGFRPNLIGKLAYILSQLAPDVVHASPRCRGWSIRSTTPGTWKTRVPPSLRGASSG